MCERFRSKVTPGNWKEPRHCSPGYQDPAYANCGSFVSREYRKLAFLSKFRTFLDPERYCVLDRKLLKIPELQNRFEQQPTYIPANTSNEEAYEWWVDICRRIADWLGPPQRAVDVERGFFHLVDTRQIDAANRSSASGGDLMRGITCMHQSAILMHMRTTLNLDDELVRKAREYTGIEEKTALIHEALRQLIASEAGKRLAALGGTMPDFQLPRRRQRRAREMILVDTSVWVDHLRSPEPRLDSLLRNRRVLLHPFVLGELACGNLSSVPERLLPWTNCPSRRLPQRRRSVICWNPGVFGAAVSVGSICISSRRP